MSATPTPQLRVVPGYKVTWLLLFLEFQGGVGRGRFRPAEDLSLFLAPQPGRLLELKPGGWELGMGLPETGGLAAPAGSWLWGKLPPRVGTMKVMAGPVLQGGNWFPLRFTGSSGDLGSRFALTACDTIHFLTFPRELVHLVAEFFRLSALQ